MSKEALQANIKKLRIKDVCNGDLLHRLSLARNKANYTPMETTHSFARQECPHSHSTCCGPDTWHLLETVYIERTAALHKSRHILVTLGDILRNLVSERRIEIFQKSLEAVQSGTRSCVQNPTFFDKFADDVAFIRDHTAATIKQGLDYIEDVERNMRSINCLMCDAPLTPEALNGGVYFTGAIIELDAESINTLLRTHLKGIKLKLFASRVHRVAVIMSCLPSIVASSQENDLVSRETELTETMALLQAKNFADPAILAEDTSHIDILATKEDLWRLHSLRESIRIFSFFINIIARRFLFDIEITDYVNSVYGRNFRTLYNRENDNYRQEFFDIKVRYSPSGMSLPRHHEKQKMAPILQAALAFWGVILLLRVFG